MKRSAKIINWPIQRWISTRDFSYKRWQMMSSEESTLEKAKDELKKGISIVSDTLTMFNIPNSIHTLIIIFWNILFHRWSAHRSSKYWHDSTRSCQSFGSIGRVAKHRRKNIPSANTEVFSRMPWKANGSQCTGSGEFCQIQSQVILAHGNAPKIRVPNKNSNKRMNKDANQIGIFMLSHIFLTWK